MSGSPLLRLASRIKRLVMMGFIPAAALPVGISAVTEHLEKLAEDE